MSRSDQILSRLMALHPKIIDLSLDRMHRILAALGNPERRIPPVIHIALTRQRKLAASRRRSQEPARRARRNRLKVMVVTWLFQYLH